MHLRRIEITDFRKITHRVVGGLEDGLNIVVGDNEVGKSTILAALRAVFFERHRVGGAVADSMQPYGSAVRPTVRVEFELDGKPWSLAKSFCQRPEASLVGPGERLSGDAVEDRLAELLGFTPPGRGGSKPDEHQGTHGLLWVEQGMRNDLGIGAGRDTLAAALESEVGQVTGGERGRALIAAAERRRERFWDKRDRPRGEMLAQSKLVDELQRESQDLAERRLVHEAKIARLAALGDMLARHKREDRLAKAIAAVGAATRTLGEAEQQRAALEQASAKRVEAERQHADALERCSQRVDLKAKLEAAQAAAGALARETDEAELVARRCGLAAREAEHRLDTARRARIAASDRLQRLDNALLRRKAEAALATQQAALAAAEAQAAERRRALAQIEAMTVDAQAVKALATLERAADQARAELAAASVQLLFQPEGDRSVSVDGADHPTGAPLRLARDAMITLEGFGRIAVGPGGGIAALASQAESAAEALRVALARYRISSVEDARRMLQDRTEAQAIVASLTRSLAALAPEGIEALRQTIESETARLARTAIQDHAASGLDEGGSIEEARRHSLDAQEAERAAEQDAKAAAAARQNAETQLATMAERSAAAVRQSRTYADDLAAARLKADDDLLTQRAATAETKLAEAAAAEIAARQTLAGTDLEIARLTLERAQRAEQETRKDIGAIEAERRDLQVELRTVGQDGIGERLSELEGELLRERKRLESMEREAAASRLLHDTLLEAQRDAKERWLGPVRRRVEPYLRLIHPDSEIRIDDRTLEIEGLWRDGVLEQFGSLSMGAREQVAVITRLALADVLRAAGQPAAVILDDALVNTDEIRLERMHNVLTRAARSLQILILTCRERDFLGLGATHRV